ncbi:unnamed protein product [Merluccius merluccius]
MMVEHDSATWTGTMGLSQEIKSVQTSGPHFSSPSTWTWFVMAIRGEHEIEKKEAAEREKRGKGGGGEIGEK